jgi:hypothetical protein
MRINIAGSPVDCHRSKKAWTKGLSWHPGGPFALVTPSQPAVRTHRPRVRSRQPVAPSPALSSSHLRWLRPGRPPIQQHFSQGPHMVRQPRGHRWRTGPPLLRGAHAAGGFWLWERLAYARVGQAAIVVDMVQNVLLLHAVLTLAEGGHSSPTAATCWEERWEARERRQCFKKFLEYGKRVRSRPIHWLLGFPFRDSCLFRDCCRRVELGSLRGLGSLGTRPAWSVKRSEYLGCCCTCGVVVNA